MKIYVNANAGYDGNGTAQMPFRHINDAAKIARPGDEVLVAPGVNVSIPIFRWGARFKTNRQQKAYIGIQKLQQSYVTDNILEELSAATTKLTETEQQVKTARENMIDRKSTRLNSSHLA